MYIHWWGYIADFVGGGSAGCPIAFDEVGMAGSIGVGHANDRREDEQEKLLSTFHGALR